jgi:hypothetical protein
MHGSLSRRKRLHNRPALRFTPYAWAKLRYLRDLGPTEVGGFGISSLADPFLVKDVHLVPQFCTAVTVRFQDEGIADYFEEQVDLGRSPQEFARIWVHTHPANSALPSHTDEMTFATAFGSADWAVMFILAREDQTYARVRFGVGPSAELTVPVRVDYSVPFPASDDPAWEAEFERCVVAEELTEALVTGRELDLAGIDELVRQEDTAPLPPGVVECLAPKPVSSDSRNSSRKGFWSR